MFIALNTQQFNKNNTIISERTRNNVIDDSYFYRFYYSDDYFNTNGIFIKFNIKDIKVEKYYNKLKCIFKNNQYNNNIIKNIINIEEQILEKFYRISNSPKTSLSLVCEACNVLSLQKSTWSHILDSTFQS